MIRRIRHKFIRIAVAVLALAMVLVALFINAANWLYTRAELQETLVCLTQNGGGRGVGMRGKRSRGFQNRLDEARFFSVLVTGEDGLLLIDSSRMTDQAGEELLALARRALEGGRREGFWEDYLFSVIDGHDDRQLAVFLNCETRLTALRKLALFSAVACLGGVLLAWGLVALFSRRAIQPMIDNAVRQKQFITDAGHELKTPLTVISANMDVLSLENEDNEWIRSTQKQVSNLRGLVNELIYLSRLDEEDAAAPMADTDLTALVRETAEPFEGMSEFKGKVLRVEAQENVRLRGDRAMLQRLVSVLCDNAVKYAPEGDTIVLTLTGDGRRAVLTAENALSSPMSRETMSHLFDRFYRVDASRSKQSGGYGIGLSVARAIVEKHGGRITARQTDDNRLRFIAILPKAGRKG